MKSRFHELISVGLSEDRADTPQQTPIDLAPGEQFRGWYQVFNIDNERIRGRLGMTIVGPEDRVIHDEPNDTWIDFSTGTAWYTRLFSVPKDATPGVYSIILAVHVDGYDDPVEIYPGLNLQRISPNVEVPILMWHKVDDIEYSRYWTGASKFDRQLTALDAYGYETISLKQLYRYLTGESNSLPKSPVVLTFDDGYQNIYTHAFPLIRDHGYLGIGFIPTGKIGVTARYDNSWDAPEVQHKAYHLVWSEIQAMSVTGHMEFGPHTVNHPDLESPCIDIPGELKESKQALAEHLNTEAEIFSFPFGLGATNESIRELVRDADYKAAVAARGGIEQSASANVWSLKRIEVASWHDTEYDGDPDHFFMRLVDQDFPIPSIGVDSVKFLNAETGLEQAAFEPGDNITIQVAASNDGSPTHVVVTLNLDNHADSDLPPIYDSHQTVPAADAKFWFVGNQGFQYSWQIPEDADIGQYSFILSFHDEHYVLGYHCTGWKKAFEVVICHPSSYHP
jgi:peptidoglycan/xylan/chitin deacetylase (PgdA/CDA1 family)